jgi:hypothetical protein
MSRVADYRGCREPKTRNPMWSEDQRSTAESICSHVEWYPLRNGTCTLLPRGELSDSRCAFTFDLLRHGFMMISEIQGLNIPKVLQPYMQGRTFLPWVKKLPKGLQKKQA